MNRVYYVILSLKFMLTKLSVSNDKQRGSGGLFIANKGNS